MLGGSYTSYSYYTYLPPSRTTEPSRRFSAEPGDKVVTESGRAKQFRSVCGAAFPPKDVDGPGLVAYCREFLGKLRRVTSKYVAALEICPTTERPHLQWCGYSTVPRTHSQWAAAVGSHERARGDWPDNVHYVLKPDTKPDTGFFRDIVNGPIADGPWYFDHNSHWVDYPLDGDEYDVWARIAAQRCTEDGCWCTSYRSKVEASVERKDPRLLTEAQLRPWQRRVEGMINRLHDTENDRLALVVVDKAGGCGKTMFCRYLLSRMDSLYITGGTHDNIMHLVAKRVLGEDAVMGDKSTSKKRVAPPADLRLVCLDVTRKMGADGYLPWGAVEQVLNGMGTSGKYNTTSFVLPYRIQVVIFTNTEPDYASLSADRWIVLNLERRGADKHIDIERIDVSKAAGQIFRAYTVAEGEELALIKGKGE